MLLARRMYDILAFDHLSNGIPLAFANSKNSFISFFTGEIFPIKPSNIVEKLLLLT